MRTFLFSLILLRSLLSTLVWNQTSELCSSKTVCQLRNVNFQTVAKESANKTNQVGICEFTREKKLRRFFDRAQDEQCAFNHLNFLFSILTLKIIYICPENVLFHQDNYKVNVLATFRRKSLLYQKPTLKEYRRVKP